MRMLGELKVIFMQASVVDSILSFLLDSTHVLHFRTYAIGAKWVRSGYDMCTKSVQSPVRNMVQNLIPSSY